MSNWPSEQKTPSTEQPTPSNSPLRNPMNSQHLASASLPTPLQHNTDLHTSLTLDPINAVVGSAKTEQGSSHEQMFPPQSLSVTQASNSPAPQLNQVSAKRLPLRKRLAQKELLANPPQPQPATISENTLSRTARILTTILDSGIVSDGGETTETDDDEIIKRVSIKRGRPWEHWPPTPSKESTISPDPTAERRFSTSYLEKMQLERMESSVAQPLKKVQHWIIKNKSQLDNITGQFVIGNPLLWKNDRQDKELPCSTDIPITQPSNIWFDGSNPAKETKSKKVSPVDLPKKSRSRRNSGRRKAFSKNPSGALYCICRKPYDARFMIACDRCNQWFHGECVGINETEGEFIDLYFCNECSKVNGKITSWKPQCANPACHQAARIGTNQGYLSKYCSDTCGLQVARARLELAQMKRHAEIHDSTSVPEAMVAKQRQSRINSLADLEDRQRLDEVRNEKQRIKSRLIGLDRRHTFLKLLIRTVLDECGYDSRLSWPENVWMQVQDIVDDSGKLLVKLETHEPFDICQQKICTKHTSWQKLILQQSEQECGEQRELFDQLCGEWEQIVSRITKRRNSADAAISLSNATIIHDS
ncbi:hypothetical protein DFQ29_004203 [Apophysomyces sp. BC1021]|nr:hypothetical protein DFQ29_004203 [Apophysomyces sp. BC1021]